MNLLASLNRYIVCFFLLAATGAQADVLNWGPTGTPQQDWTAGNTTQAFTINGVVVTITITKSVNTIAWLNNAPHETADVSGGTGQNSLELELQHPNQSSFVTVAITFSKPVRNISIPLYDIDRFLLSYQGQDYGYADQIRNIQGRNTSNVWGLGASSVTGTGIDNTVTGSGTSYVVSGIGSSGPNNDNTANGNATITFNQTVTGVRFDYGNVPAGGGNVSFEGLTEQRIGLGDITYTVVPECGSALAGAFLIFGAISIRRRKTLEIL